MKTHNTDDGMAGSNCNMRDSANQKQWRFERTITLGHVIVVSGLLANAAVLAFNYGKNMQRIEIMMTENRRRIDRLEVIVEKITDVQYSMREQLAVMTELVRKSNKQPQQ